MAADNRACLMNQCKAILDSQVGTKEFEFCGKSFIGFENVFHIRVYSEQDEIYAKKLPPETAEDSRFLEIGCGTGCVSVIHYLRNETNLRYVLATDINRRALQNTEENFKRYNIPGHVRYSDVFEEISEEEKFDTILWNIPFYYTPPETKGLSDLDLSYTDPGYGAVSRYISGVQKHLRPGGKAIIGFSTTCGHIDILENIAEKENQRLQLIGKEETNTECGPISFELFKLIPIKN